MPITHVVNGDCTAELIRQSGIPGDVLVFTDVLHEGPVLHSPIIEHHERRSQFLSECGWGDYQQILQNYHSQEEALMYYAEEGRLILWCEHDVYDQLLLARWLTLMDIVLDQPRDQHIVCVGHVEGHPNFHGLGELKPSDIAHLMDKRRPVTYQMLADGHMAWHTLCADGPAMMEVLAQHPISHLPYMSNAMHRMIHQYPAQGSGLWRTAEQILACLSDGLKTPVQLFANDSEMEQSPFMGDATFWLHLERLSDVPDPALTWEDGTPFKAHKSLSPVPEAFINSKVQITELGLQALHEEVDFVRHNNISYWIGGVQISEDSPWRRGDDGHVKLMPG